MYLMIAEYLIIMTITLIVYYFLLKDQNKATRFLEEELSEKHVVGTIDYQNIKTKLKSMEKTYKKAPLVLTSLLILTALFFLTFLCFYDYKVSLVYTIISIFIIWYVITIRYRGIYNRFIFNQVVLYTSLIISEYQKQQSIFVALSKARENELIIDPLKKDIDYMIGLIASTGNIKQGLEYMNLRYNYYILHDAHNLLYAFELAKGETNIDGPLNNMLRDVDKLVENVYSSERKRKEIRNNLFIFLLISFAGNYLFQIIVGFEEYLLLLKEMWFVITIHITVILNLILVLVIEHITNRKFGE
jgi:hypothetical protein